MSREREFTEALFDYEEIVMCWCLLRNKFFWIGLAIYLLPGFIFLGWGFATMPRPTGYSDSGERVAFPMFPIALMFFIGILLAFPVISLFFIRAPIIPVAVILYFGTAYGLLYLYMRKHRKRKLQFSIPKPNISSTYS